MKDKLRQGKSKGPSEGYSKFRVRWRHVLVIDQQVRAGRAPNCRRLAEELEVSRRTVLRDVDFLRYDLGAPIEYDPAKGGYVYTEPNWTMPSVRITEGELLALMVAEKALDAYAGTPWANKLRQVFGRMTVALPDRVEVHPRELLPRLEFDGSAAAIVDPAVIQTIESALRGDQTLRIRYAPLGRAEGEYVLDPYVLRQMRGAWYLAGRDHRSGQAPLFNVRRIRSASPTGETFNFHAADFDPKEYFKATFGAYQTSERYRIVVEFSDVAAQLVRERQWHASQKLKDLPGGRLRLEVEVSHLDDIWPWVLSWGGCAKVIGPKELACRVAEEAGVIARQYRTITKGKRE